MVKSPFKSRTGLMGATETGQKVNKDNIAFLPPGSVIRCDDNGRIIHLHDDVWLHCTDRSWVYDNVERMEVYLPGVLCHIP